ncbi:MAG: ester cyclase [Solirubrobacterales bacterium]
MSNKAIVEALVSAIDEGDEASVRAIVDESLVSHGALGDVHGADGFIGVMLQNVRRGFPDAHVEAVAIVSEGDMASFRLDGSGTHLGSFLGVEPTGKTIRIRGIHHVRIRDGRIVEHWQGPDILAMLLDMGLFPPGRSG